MKPPKFLKKYFWDVDFEKLNLEKRQEYIILRILELGDIKSVRWLLENIPKEKIKNAIMNKRGLSLKSLYFWISFFNINKEKILCLKKSYQKAQKNHWQY